MSAIDPIYALVAAAYLIGAIPFGLVLARVIAGVDPRKAGSGNIGATNVLRTAGKTVGILTLVLDAAKGAAPVLVASFVLHASVRWAALAGLAAVLGHVFPIYLGFRGGKGVATAAGVFAALTPLPMLVATGVFAVVAGATRIISVGSLAATVALSISAWFLDGRPEVFGLSLLVTLLVFVRHTGNIRRLFQRSENKV